MGYRIDYGQKQKACLGAKTAGWFLVFLLLVSIFWPKGRELLGQILLPGDRAVTAAAWEDFAQDLGAGLGFSEAVEAFCRKILEGSP